MRIVYDVNLIVNSLLFQKHNIRVVGDRSSRRGYCGTRYVSSRSFSCLNTTFVTLIEVINNIL